jgi:uncharacterized protein YjbI with pentapeptide repeats
MARSLTEPLNLQGVYFANARLQYANFAFAKLQKADFSGAFLDGAGLSLTQMEGADLSRTHVTNTSVAHIDLTKVNLDGANWSDADFDYYGPDFSITFDRAMIDRLFATLDSSIPAGARNMAW